MGPLTVHVFGLYWYFYVLGFIFAHVLEAVLDIMIMPFLSTSSFQRSPHVCKFNKQFYFKNIHIYLCITDQEIF